MRWVVEWWWFGGEKEVMSVLKEGSAVRNGGEGVSMRTIKGRSDGAVKEDPSRAVTLANDKACGK